MTTVKTQTRLLALGLFAFLGLFGAIIWYLMRPYGTAYFFPVHFLIGAALPFLICLLYTSDAAHDVIDV